MDPLSKREILYMALRAGRDKADRYQPRFALSLNAIAGLPRNRSASLAIAEKREFLHAAAKVTVVPSGKAHKRYVLVWQLHPNAGIAVIRRQTEMAHSEASLKSLLANQPVGWALFFRVCSPGVKPCCHEGFVAREGNHGSDTERGDELPSANGSVSRHLFVLRLREFGKHTGVAGRIDIAH
jgi:hypothetical protein